MRIINSGYPKNGTPESIAHWNKIRAKLKPFVYDPPKETLIYVPNIHLDQVRAYIKSLENNHEYHG